MRDGYALAMLVLCTATVLQLAVQTLWSIRNARVFRMQYAGLERLRKRIADKLAQPHELIELTREHVELMGRVESIERQVGIARWRPPAFDDEPIPATKPAGIK